MEERVPTGIPGLDQMVGGGFLKGRPYLVNGGPGVGKTIFSTQFLIEGLRRGEKVLYFTMDEPFDEILDNTRQFSWPELRNIRFMDMATKAGTDLWSSNIRYNQGDARVRPFMIREADLEETRQVTFDMPSVVEAIQEELEKGVDRMVVDSITSLRLLSPEEHIREDLMGLMNFFASYDTTTLITSEYRGENTMIDWEAFAARGVMRLSLVQTESFKRTRTISVEKMRGTAFDDQIRPLRINDKGIEVMASASVYR